jgi:alpha-mannosidase
MEKQTGKLSMGITLQWLQPSQMVKLSLKPGWENAACYAQDMFGRKQTECDGKENVNQKWLLLAGDQQALSVINTGIYAHDFFDNELRITLMHSPGYCAHPLENRVVLPQDRFLARVDTGERHFELVLTAGDRNERLDRVDREALEENEEPFALSFFPTGKKKQFAQGISVDNEKLVLSAFIRKGETYQIRLYNPTDVRQGASVSVGNATVLDNIEFAPFEVKTLELNV